MRQLKDAGFHSPDGGMTWMKGRVQVRVFDGVRKGNAKILIWKNNNWMQIDSGPISGIVEQAEVLASENQGTVPTLKADGTIE